MKNAEREEMRSTEKEILIWYKATKAGKYKMEIKVAFKVEEIMISWIMKLSIRLNYKTERKKEGQKEDLYRKWE